MIPLPGRLTGLELHAPLLDGHQRGSRPEIVRFLREKVPAQDGQLASHRHGGDLVATPSPNADEERMQRSRRLRGSPGSLNQHRARMAASDLANAAVLGETKPGLANTRVQPDIAHELLRRGEAADIADRSDEPRRDRDVDPGDGDQSLDRRIADCALGHLPVEHLQIIREPVELPEVPVNRRLLVGRKRLTGKPVPAAPVEQVGVRAARDQMGVKDRVHLVLDPGAVPDELIVSPRPPVC